MAAVGETSTAHINSRNQAGISQAQLSHIPNTSPRQSSPLASEPSMPLTKPDRSAQPRPQSGHGRSSSFFTSFRNKDKATSGTEPLQTTRSNDTNVSETGRLSSESRGQQPTVQAMNKPQPSPPSQQTPTTPVQGNLLHPEIRSVISLIVAHAHKVYYSGPLVKRVERQPDGQKPHKDEGWVQVWAQLGGTTLSIWDMKAVEEASKRGEEVPPTYINMTDAFVQVLGSVTVTGSSNAPPQKFANVLTLNTAGSNLILFSCPSPEALMSWAAALRLSAWEKSRLEEIYTAHLIRITFNNQKQDKLIPTTLVRGKLEGWARVRVAGQTEWKQLWLVITAANSSTPTNSSPNVNVAQNTAPKKNRMSLLFSRESSDATLAGPSKANISLFSSSKQKDRKAAVLTMHNVTQAFAVYPERPELITRSTLIKVEGSLGNEEAAGAMASREGWLLIMPVLENTEHQSVEMLKWLTALHDAFRLYGRPDYWSWDPYDTRSLMFAYPVGETKNQLFLDREAAEQLDPRDDRTSLIRAGLLNITKSKHQAQHGHLRPAQSQETSPSSTQAVQPGSSQQSVHRRFTADAPPSLPPIGENSIGPQIPPLSFDSEPPRPESGLSPIRETSTSSSNYSSAEGGLTHSISMLSTEAPKTNERKETGQGNGFEVLITSSPRSYQGNGLTTLSPVNGNHVLEAHKDFNGNARQDPQPTRIGHFSPTSQRSLGSPPPSRPSQESSPHQYQASTGVSPAGSGRPSLDSRSPPPLTTVVPPSQSYVQPPRQDSPHTSYGITSYTLHDSPTSTTSLNRPSTPPTPISLLTSPHSPLTDTPQPLPSLKEMTGSIHGSPRSSIAPLSIKGKEEHNVSKLSVNEPRAPVPVTASPPAQQRPLSPQTRAQGSNFATPQDTVPVAPSRRFTSEQQGRETAAPMHTGFTRRPSGARVPPASRQHNLDDRLSPPVPEEGIASEASSMSEVLLQRTATADTEDAEHLDALAALSYLDVNSDSPAAAPEKPAMNQIKPLSPKPRATEPSLSQTSPQQEPGQFRSSFAPSKHASERKAKVQAQQAAHHAATHKPGRAGKGPTKGRPINQGTWSSEDEDEDEDEDEEDEEDEDDLDTDAVAAKAKPSSPHPNATSNGSPHEFGQQPGHARPPRTLPQPPGSGLRPSDSDEFHPKRTISDQYPDANRGTQHGGTSYGDGAQIRYQSEAPLPGTARQTMWSQVLDPSRKVEQPAPDNGKFVQLEDSAHMTKAFTPHGLLSAGLQDKQDRSAKRQEELARESGASLVNVPNKPPPPQSGLLGAITAHERDRKREGGMGAALTERERERRLAEERQRKFDEAQRQQLEQMQTGSMYGGQFGYNPMMNPMMMGMNPMMPMMTGGPMTPMMTGQMGYGGFNPQHMFAAQQAAQAYQQAMMAFSVAGSQAGDTAGQQQQMGGMSPMMTGGMSFDPRMTMMSGMGGMGGMGMMGNPMMNPMGMQMTGMSQFDPRFSPNGASPSGELHAPSAVSGGQFNPQTGSSSPLRHGSPLARSTGTPDNARSSPKV